jgi:hypothetical protein
MAEKDGRIQGFGRPASTGKPDVLRAKDIIPGGRGTAKSPGIDDSASRVDIPQFDLAADIMAEQRRLTAIHRKGPGDPAPVPFTGKQVSSDSALVSRRSETRQVFFRGISAGYDPVIAEIVARDIERLCSGVYLA